MLWVDNDRFYNNLAYHFWKLIFNNGTWCRKDIEMRMMIMRKHWDENCSRLERKRKILVFNCGILYLDWVSSNKYLHLNFSSQVLTRLALYECDYNHIQEYYHYISTEVNLRSKGFD